MTMAKSDADLRATPVYENVASKISRRYPPIMIRRRRVSSLKLLTVFDPQFSAAAAPFQRLLHPDTAFSYTRHL